MLEVASVLGREFGLEHLVMVTGRSGRWWRIGSTRQRGRHRCTGRGRGRPLQVRARRRSRHALRGPGPGASGRAASAGGRGARGATRGPDRVPLAELTHHFVEAAPGGEPEKAADYAWWAGERASAQHAYEDAARHFEQALGLFESRLDEPVRAASCCSGSGMQGGDRGHRRRKEIFLEAAELARETPSTMRLRARRSATEVASVASGRATRLTARSSICCARPSVIFPTATAWCACG